MLLSKIIDHLYFFNFKTIYFNFKYLPFKQAIKLPILISKYTYLKKCSGTIEIKNSKIYTGMIRIGKVGVGIFDEKKSRNIWQVGGKVIFEGKCVIGQGSRLSVGHNATITFGNNFTITAESSIICHKNIKFGNDCLLSWDILIMDTDSHKIKNKDNDVINSPKEIIVGNHVWIGCRATILKGSLIPDDSIIGANTTVNRRLENTNSIFAGNPIKEVKREIYWEE